jgi:hypothetical protein
MEAVGFYQVPDGSLATAVGSAAGTYPFKIFVGDPSDSDDDPWVGFGVYRTNGTVELPPESDVTRWTGTAPVTPNEPGIPRVDVTHVSGEEVCD